MQIGGLQKTTLIDFPGKVSAIIFTQGCNFHCPYCHNPELVKGRATSLLQQKDILAFLSRRHFVLQGVVITGGEPTLQDDLPEFCQQVKDLGYAIKLDTNGSNPRLLQRLLEQHLLDYVALDLKTEPGSYPVELCPPALGQRVLQSLALLRELQIQHEYRVTCAAPFVTSKTFTGIVSAVEPGATLYLQKLRLQHVLDPEFFPSRGKALREEDIEQLCKEGIQAGLRCHTR